MERTSKQEIKQALKIEMARAMEVVFQLVVVLCVVNMITAHLVIPFKFDGFVYNNRMYPQSVTLEAFVDPMCEDSSASWKPLKEVADSFKEKVTLIVHPFPLPYRENAFIISRALHSANRINKAHPFTLLDDIFQNQTHFSEMTVPPMNITEAVMSFVLQVIGQDITTRTNLKQQMDNIGTEWDTRMSFMYACSRAVTRTPYFFVNGIPLSSMGKTLDATQMKSIIQTALDKGK